MIKMKQIQIVGKLIGCLGLALIPLSAGYIIHDLGVEQGLEEAELRSQREKIVLTHTGYKHLADKDHDGNFDVLRTVQCGQESSDILYVRKGHGPAQSVDSVVKVVDERFFKKYNTTFYPGL